MIAQTSAWHSGTTLILPAPTFNPVSSVDAIVNEKCTGIYGTPTMWVRFKKKNTEYYKLIKYICKYFPQIFSRQININKILWRTQKIRHKIL